MKQCLYISQLRWFRMSAWKGKLWDRSPELFENVHALSVTINREITGVMVTARLLLSAAAACAAAGIPWSRRPRAGETSENARQAGRCRRTSILSEIARIRAAACNACIPNNRPMLTPKAFSTRAAPAALSPGSSNVIRRPPGTEMLHCPGKQAALRSQRVYGFQSGAGGVIHALRSALRPFHSTCGRGPRSRPHAGQGRASTGCRRPSARSAS